MTSGQHPYAVVACCTTANTNIYAFPLDLNSGPVRSYWSINQYDTLQLALADIQGRIVMPGETGQRASFEPCLNNATECLDALMTRFTLSRDPQLVPFTGSTAIADGDPVGRNFRLFVTSSATQGLDQTGFVAALWKLQREASFWLDGVFIAGNRALFDQLTMDIESALRGAVSPSQDSVPSGRSTMADEGLTGREDRALSP